MDTNDGNSPTSTSDSWLFVKRENDGNIPRGEKSEELEDSDGISVISESEMYKNHANQNDDNDATLEKPIIEENEEDEAEEALDLLTPPVTPNLNNNDDDDDEGDKVTAAVEKYKKSKELEVHQEKPSIKLNSHYQSQSHGAMLLLVMALIIAFLYTNISSLKNEFASTASMYEERIARLEEENQLLKSQLNELIKQLKESQQVKVVENLHEPQVDEKLQKARFIERQEEAIQKPITKDVWMGGEKEDVVKILDKKYNSLPDYCYFTDESDLFYEYNKENCERKKRKLEQRVKKYHQQQQKKAESVDDIYKKRSDNVYDEQMSQTTEQLLKSLNDEIQDIKSSRISYSITDNDEDKPYNPNDELIIEQQSNSLKNDDKKKKKKQRNFNENIQVENNTLDKKKKKSKRQQSRDGNEWLDRRTAAREEARKQNIDKSEENWFIKRKNDREIHRLEQKIH